MPLLSFADIAKIRKQRKPGMVAMDKELTAALRSVKKIGSVSYDWNDDETGIYIKEIESTEPGKGYGRQLLRLVCALADKHKVELALAPLSFVPPSWRNKVNSKELISKKLGETQLRQWYTRYGFTPPKSGSGYDETTELVRYPKGS